MAALPKLPGAQTTNGLRTTRAANFESLSFCSKTQENSNFLFLESQTHGTGSAIGLFLELLNAGQYVLPIGRGAVGAGGVGRLGDGGARLRCGRLVHYLLGRGRHHGAGGRLVRHLVVGATGACTGAAVSCARAVDAV